MCSFPKGITFVSYTGYRAPHSPKKPHDGAVGKIGAKRLDKRKDPEDSFAVIA